jgi:hypothetical protein
MSEDIYKRLAKHLSSLGMGYPEKEELLEILREKGFKFPGDEYLIMAAFVLASLFTVKSHFSTSYSL